MSAFAGAGAQVVNTTAGNKAATLAGATAGDLLVVVCLLTGATTPPTVTDDNASGTYVEVSAGGFFKNTSLDGLWVFVRSALVPATASTIITMTSPGGDTGGGLLVYRVTGMTRTGAAAVRQVAGQSNQAAAGTPAPAFGSACLSANSILGAVLNESNPATLTPTASPVFTEKHDTGYNTPTTGVETQTLDSGFTGSTLTWGGTSATQFASVAVELEAGPVTNPRAAAQPRASVANRLARVRRASIVSLRPLALAVQAAAAVVRPPAPTVLTRPRGRPPRPGDVVAPRAAALQATPTPPRGGVTVKSSRPLRRRTGGVVAPRPAALPTLPAAFAPPPRGVIIDTRRTSPAHAARIIAPRPAALAAGQVAAVVRPPAPVIVAAHAPMRSRSAAHVTAPRPAALPTLPPAFARPPAPATIRARRPSPARTAHVTCPRPAALAATPPVVVRPPAPVVIVARTLTRPRSRGDVLAPRPTFAAPPIVVTPPRPTIIHAAGRAAPRQQASRCIAPRPRFVQATPPRGVVVRSSRPQRRGRGGDVIALHAPVVFATPGGAAPVFTPATRVSDAASGSAAAGSRGRSRLGGTSAASSTIGSDGRTDVDA